MDIDREIRRIKQQVRGTGVAPAVIDAVDGLADIITNMTHEVYTCSIKPMALSEAVPFRSPKAQSVPVVSESAKPTPRKAKKRTTPKAKKQKAKSEDA